MAVPPAATRHTAAGAEAFARLYLNLVNQAWSTPDPDLIRPLVLPTCRSCANDISTAESLKREGERYEGPASAVDSSIVTPDHTAQERYVLVVLRQLKQRIIDRDGDVVEVAPPASAQIEVAVRWRDSQGWRISTIKTVRS